MTLRTLRLLIIALMLLGLVILTGCTTAAPITLPAPPPVRYECVTPPVGVVNGQVVYLSI